MSVARAFRILRQRLRALLHTDAMDAELQRELAFHLELLVREYEADGLTRAQARLAARRALGSPALVAEQCRDQRHVRAFHDLRQDAVFGVRMLRRNPGVTAVAVVSLALGIGANTAIVGVMDAALRRSLSIPDDGRVVVARTYPSDDPGRQANASIAEYFAWRDHNRSFDLLSASIGNQSDFGADGDGTPAERVQGQAASAALFAVLGVRPVLGRVYTESEDQAGAGPQVVVISHRLWRQRFGGSADVLGHLVRMNAVAARVIGVMPEGFHYPSAVVDYWLPLRANRDQLFSPERFFVVTGRLKAGVTPAQAQADLDALSDGLARQRPGRGARWGVRITPVREAMFGWTRQPLVTLWAAVALVLLVACANVAGLLLARGLLRQPEIAMRRALGAAHGRIVRQLLTESVLLATAGGILGAIVAWAGVRALASMSPPPGGVGIGHVSFDPWLLGVTALLSMATVLVFGVAPALSAARAGAVRASAGTRAISPRLRSALVGAQIAVTVVLLVGAGLLVKSVVRQYTRDLNFDPSGILTFEVHYPIASYLTPIGSTGGLPYFEIGPRPALAMQRIQSRLRALPGVESVSVISYAPVNSIVVPTMTLDLEAAGSSADEAPGVFADVGTIADYVSGQDQRSAAYFLVTPHFLSDVRARFVRGRDFDERDTMSSPWTAIVNESAARQFWPDRNPIGQRFRLRAVTDERPREVVGVIRDIPLTVAQTEPRPVVYTSYRQQPARFRLPGANMFGQLTFMVRTTGDPAALAPAARQVVAAIDRDRPLSNVQTMDGQLRGLRAQRATYVVVLGVFALVAMALAAVGIYGVLAYAVSNRTREIGVRMALGARRGDVVAMVGWNAVIVVALGMIGGVVGALAFSRLLRSQLWGVAPTDPATFAGVVALVLAVVFLACAVPIRRATAVEPTVALRAE